MNTSVRPLLLKALQLIKAQDIKPGRALDFGVGSGSETAYLLKEGYQVTAIDNFKEFLTELKLHEANQPYLSQLTTLHSDFETLDWHMLKPVDLFVALFSLGYIQPEFFFDVWHHIVSLIKPGGYFVGQLYTQLILTKQRDGYTIDDELGTQPFLSKKEIKDLFSRWTIIYFENARTLYNEADATEPTIYSIIARKH